LADLADFTLGTVMKTGLRVLVTGGRDYADPCNVAQVLGKLLGESGVTCLIEGGAKGADALAREWARDNGIAVITCPADWSKGRAAGPMRNTSMLRDHRPDVVVAFPGGRGTADMVGKAEKAGVRVLRG
jgi:predicted Rossmann-fold nucleotide-binding protein